MKAVERQFTPRSDSDKPIVIDRLRAFAVSAKTPSGPVSSLGDMPVRNGVLVEITTNEGVIGWGEVWCNFPPRGNLARLNLLQDVIAPQVVGATFKHYSDCRPKLEDKFARMAIHTGEFGVYAHCYAGIDMALADIASRSDGLSLSHYLTKEVKTSVPVYASTPNVNDLENSIAKIIENDYLGIKLKIGLGQKKDSALLQDVLSFSQGRLRIMVDANQNWNVIEAIECMSVLSTLSDNAIRFVEEPLRADASMKDWAQLAAAIDVPLAGGENITSCAHFEAFMDHGQLGVVQPDLAKWGGVSGAIEVAELVDKRKAICALHYMGSGLGLAASVHVLAAIGGNGPLEIDSNPNPLRTELGELNLQVRAGELSVPDGLGHGFVPDTQALASFSIAQFEMT